MCVSEFYASEDPHCVATLADVGRLGLNREIPYVPIPPTTNVQPASDTATTVHPIPIPPGALNPAAPDQQIHDHEGSHPRSHSQPPPSSRKSVQFSETPEITTFTEPALAETDGETSLGRRHHHRHRHANSRGYEAEDDTDSTLDDVRRRHDEHSTRPRGADREEGESADRSRHHHRHRSHDPSSRGEGSSRKEDSHMTPHDRVSSPADSEATIDLPSRFDDKGRKKLENGDDPLADKFQDLLQGKGSAGKVFENLIDGLFGSDGKKKRSSR